MSAQILLCLFTSEFSVWLMLYNSVSVYNNDLRKHHLVKLKCQLVRPLW